MYIPTVLNDVPQNVGFSLDAMAFVVGLITILVIPVRTGSDVVVSIAVVVTLVLTVSIVKKYAP